MTYYIPPKLRLIYYFYSKSGLRDIWNRVRDERAYDEYYIWTERSIFYWKEYKHRCVELLGPINND